MSRYHADPDFEPRIADWLEADPDHAPAEVLATVRAAFPSIPQRHVTHAPRRLQTMNRFALFGAAAAIALAVGFGGLWLATRSTGPSLGMDPTSTPAPTAAPSSAPPSLLTSTFTSPVYGYSIKIEPAWAVTPATIAADDPASADNGEDRIRPTGTDTTVGVTVTSLGSTTFDAYLDTLYEDIQADGIPESCKPGEPSTWPTITVGVRDGLRVIKCNFEQALVNIDDRVYTFTWAHETFENKQHLDHARYEELLASVTFPSTPPSLSPVPAEPSPATSVSPSTGTSDALGPLVNRTTADDVGISIAYPGAWTEARHPAGGHSVTVELGAPGETKEVMLNAEWRPLPPGQTADDWIAERSIVVENQAACRPEPANAEIQVGGHAGALIDEGCSILGSRRHFLAVVVVGERGYSFHMDSKILDLAAFRTLLANVILDPTAGA